MGHNEEGISGGNTRRKIPRMFQTHDESGHNREHTPEDTPNHTLESIDITLKGGVETKLFLNRLHTRE
jgi:hypothetical protein